MAIQDVCIGSMPPLGSPVNKWSFVFFKKTGYSTKNVYLKQKIGARSSYF